MTALSSFTGTMMRRRKPELDLEVPFHTSPLTVADAGGTSFLRVLEALALPVAGLAVRPRKGLYSTAVQNGHDLILAVGKPVLFFLLLVDRPPPGILIDMG
jgi:hypothetical protein